ncbi:efflux RND transporter periplasmic adaptor subunit [Planctobacterium marinum]|uniref:efflux RND transporter periplasmic adaptor subunit n=1 Tax=Planctobacterium marinum TaxID=1631968 RepID=UPI001E61417C|nr:efflux RND transporter periplasmic adaptor subunit [Planctobacterium marinum]MCC2607129.1 efflux RND transporter periplasmic adaptor subunit [Planctobacterium marinum]
MRKSIANAMASVAIASTLIVTSMVSYAQFGPTPVNVEAAQMRMLAPVSSVSGAIVSQNDSQVAARVSGQLVQVAKVGTRVQAGETFAVIRDPSLVFRHAEQLARMKSSESNLTFQNSEVNRLRSLAERDLSSKTELDRTLAARDQAQAEVQENKALLDQIELSQSYQNMQAPFDGVIMERLADVGELVAPGTAVVRLVQTTDLEVSARVPVASLAYVTPGKTISFSSSVGNGQAVVRTTVPVADNRSRLVEVRADVTDDKWPVGLDITAKVPSGAEKQVLAVHRDALVLRRDGARVFRINGENKAEQVMVETGIATERWIEVSGDIQEGDKIVIRGAERLQPGQQVMIRENNESLISQ